MKHLLLVVLLFFSTPCFAQVFKLEYRSPQMLIMVHDQNLTRFDTEFVYENANTTIPTSANTKEKKISLSSEQVNEMQRLVRKSGFISLQDYYGAKEYEQFHPYTLEVNWQKIQKKVLFRSGQIQDPRPQAFSEIESYLLALTK